MTADQFGLIVSLSAFIVFILAMACNGPIMGLLQKLGKKMDGIKESRSIARHNRQIKAEWNRTDFTK
jgi:hypothetical protein